MIVINARNVNEALPLGIMYLKHNGQKITVRGMETIEYPTPVTTVYQRPWERVLLCPVRDANPFFHFFESLWILNGRNDVMLPAIFNSNISQYSDDGKIFHGAYGHRLRNCGKDQLKEAIKHFKADPNTRQVVLQIWDSNKDLNVKSNDIPCNDLIICKIRDEKLNITVCNRSNDIIWGCYGANAVQFSYIQEYLATMIGCDIGVYRQVSDSFHAYTNNPQWEKLKNTAPNDVYPYKYYPMITDTKSFDDELTDFLTGQWKLLWHNKFFPEVAIPMWEAWFNHKAHKSGYRRALQIEDEAWMTACSQWLLRREQK